MKNGQVARVIGGNSEHTYIEFLGDYSSKRMCSLSNLKKGLVKNYMAPTVYNIGIVGEPNLKSTHIKEYQVWADMLYRCSEHYKNKYHDTYYNASISDKFVYFLDFYKWLQSQENYEKWKLGYHWCIDKDIIGGKGNKIYAPENCCLVPNNVNTLFVKKDLNRGSLPIGVTKNHDGFMAICSNPFTHDNHCYLGTYTTPDLAFQAYKTFKENIIQRVAENEYTKKNITKECYEAMLLYRVEITD